MAILASDGKLKYEKIPFIISSQNPITCEEMFYKTVKFINNPDYQVGNGQTWVLIKYKNENVFAHFCKDRQGNYVR